VTTKNQLSIRDLQGLMDKLPGEGGHRGWQEQGLGGNREDRATQPIKSPRYALCVDCCLCCHHQDTELAWLVRRLTLCVLPMSLHLPPALLVRSPASCRRGRRDCRC
jgi:hypothetical protein